ncbi:MAG: histidine kinase, partial [Treponema sp.]|nr:histidine kinase [Treponema sp.]
MKTKLFIVFFLIFFTAAGSRFCAAENTQKIIFIQDIYVQWIEMEHQLSLENIDVLYTSIQSYLNSESYRIYRFMPFSTAFGFGHTDPNELYEVTAVIELLEFLRSAVLNGEHEEVKEISNNITSNLVKALAWDSLAEQFTTGAYIRLFLILFSIIVIAVIIIIFLNKELIFSLRREEEGSIYSRAVLLAQERERSRLSRELHDTIAQDLRYMSLEMSKISKTTEQTKREKLCIDAAAFQSGLICKVRDICDYLVPPDFR